jgi:hypothetical protein
MTKPCFVNGASLFADIPDTMFLSGGSIRRALANNTLTLLSAAVDVWYSRQWPRPARRLTEQDHGPSVYVRAMKEAGGME